MTDRVLPITIIEFSTRKNERILCQQKKRENMGQERKEKKMYRERERERVQ